MADLFVKVSCVKQRHRIQTEDYREAWLDSLDDAEREEAEESDSPVPAEFAVNAFKEELDDGQTGLDEIFEGEAVEVEQLA